jgi:hypothetical protein
MMNLRRLLVHCTGLMLGLAGLWTCAHAEGAAPDRPVVFNAPASSRPGDVVGLQGAFFGDAPVVSLKGTGGQADVVLPLLNTFGTGWLSFKIPKEASAALKVTVSNGLASSEPVVLNGARAYHLDALAIAPDGAFRVFGRNLVVAGFVPSLVVNGMAARVDLAASDEHMLVAVAPHGLRPNGPAAIAVDNGNGSGPSVLDRSIAVVAGGADVFGLGVGWGAGFAPVAAHVVALGADGKAVCNGQPNDTPVVQAAMDQLSNAGGGVVQLPAGECHFATSLLLKSRVVLQGRGKDATRVRYDASYPLWGRKLDLVGVADLTLQSTRAGIESTLLQDSTRAFFKNVRFELGGGLHMFLNGNTNLVVLGSDMSQAQNPGMNGVYFLGGAAGLSFVNNTTTFAHGAPSFSQIHDAYIANNRFIRDARQSTKSKGVLHSMALDFAYRVAVVGNHFEVLGAPVIDKYRNDGETILTEGGGAGRTERLGTVAGATALSLNVFTTAQTGRSLPTGNVPENYGVAIVGGTGAGQSRRVTDLAGTTLSVDKPWAQMPDTSSRYATFVWGLEKSIIKGNTLKDNPRGIWLYQTAVRDVDIVDNEISEGGGIYLRTAQSMKDQLFTPMYVVRIANNQIINTKGEWRSYISVMFVRMDEYEFGVGTTGVEVRNNRLVANTPNLTQPQEESGGAEGFINRMHTEGQTQLRSMNQTRLLGTVLQDNQCSGCNIGVIVRDGAQGSVQDNNTNKPPGLPK